ncbi:MAG: cyclase family protein [Bacillota bacterium]
MSRIIDLTLDLYQGMPVFPAPWYPNPEMSFVLTPDQDAAGRTASKVVLFNHAGTHMDAPLHFVRGGQPIDRVPLETLFGTALVVDMYQKGNLEPITAQDLDTAVALRSGSGFRLLIRTGYTTRNWGRRDYFSASPYLTQDAAEWIVRQGFCLVAIDFQTDRPGDASFPVHKTLLGNGVIIVEYLTNVEAITRDRVLLVALPLRLRGLEASPCRVIAVEE